MAESRAETVGRVMAHSPAETQSRREAALKYPLGRRPAAKRAGTRGAKDAALAAFAVEKAAHERRIAELERQLAELRQILKDAGYCNDPKPLERLGLHLVSGRTHWKLQYASVRVTITMSKTPSDYRANLNNGSEIANRCF